MAKQRGTASYLGVLGPVQAWDEAGREVLLARGERRLLAALIARVNEVIGQVDLADTLWPPDDSEYDNDRNVQNLFDPS